MALPLINAQPFCKIKHGVWMPVRATMNTEREKIDFDVVFVGGGPANLAGAIRLMQLAQAQGVALEVALIDKGAEIGSHAVSGAILNPIALQELMPDFREQGFPE
jgi:electron-transferring-flavoprotein dehydrogenase